MTISLQMRTVGQRIEGMASCLQSLNYYYLALYRKDFLTIGLYLYLGHPSVTELKSRKLMASMYLIKFYFKSLLILNRFLFIPLIF